MAENLASFPSLSSTGPPSLGGPDSHLSLGDDEPDFVHETERLRFQCPVHKGLLRDAIQTSCGHRLCRRCVGLWLNGAPSKRCPVGDSDCHDITESNVFPDRSVLNDLKSVEVFCKNKQAGCKVQVRLRDLKAHLDRCEFQPVPCEFTSRGCPEDKVQRGKLRQHMDSCPFRPVRCPLCQEEVNHNQLKNHEDETCPEKVTGCVFGCNNKTLKRREVPGHRDVCPVHPVDCKFKHMGCKFVGQREAVERHEKEDLSQHLELITQHVAQLQLQSLDIQSQIRGHQADRNVEKQIGDFRLKLVSLMEKVIIVERKTAEFVTLDQTVAGLQQRLAQVEQAQQARDREQQQQQQGGNAGGGGGAAVVGRYGTVENMADAFSTQLSGHDRQLTVHDIRMAEMDLRFQLLETASYDGTLVWKIRDYERRKRDAVNGRTLSLYSQPFYTGRFGYKMCARVYLNGDGMGKTTHMSLFFVVMRGEYDALLVWPFRQKVTLTLLDQSPEKRHLTDHFQPDPNSTSFQRPTTEMNVASGCPLFVSHAVLENPANGYLRDDTIFIRIVVDVNPNPAVY